MGNNSGLGALDKLPPEVRRSIWQNFLPQQQPQQEGQEYINPKSDLRVLRVRKQINQEVSTEVYRYETLVFHVLPEYKYKSWFKITNSAGAEWIFKDYLDAEKRGLVTFPWNKLNGLRIDISAPLDPMDDGQILCLYKKLSDVVELLEKANCLPKLDLFFKDTATTPWFDGLKPRQFSHNFDNYPLNFIWMSLLHTVGGLEVEMMLRQFRRIRRITRIDIRSGESVTSSKLYVNIEELEKIILGAPNSDVYHFFREKRSKRNVNDMFHIVEQAMDEMVSPTASLLRLHRFASWFSDKLHGNSRYEAQQLKHRPYITRDHVEGQVSQRYMDMRSLNPLAHDPLVPDSAHHHSTDWDEDSWHRHYPNGLLPSLRLPPTVRAWRTDFCALVGTPLEERKWLTHSTGEHSYFQHMRQKYKR